MIKNYVLLVYRTFIRSWFYSTINLFGLAIGIAACIVCYLHISYELSYDTNHTKKDRIFRIIIGEKGTDDLWVKMAAPIPPELKNRFPEVEDYLRIGQYNWDPKLMVKSNDRIFNEDRFLLVDQSFFTIFDFNLIAGNPDRVLEDMNSVVITESNARKYFGNEDPLGKVIKVDNTREYQVTGIIEDPPYNSHLDYDFLISFQNLNELYGENASNSWGGFNYFAYLLLKEGTDDVEFEKKMGALNIEYREGQTMSFESIHLQALTDIHFQSNRGNQKPAYDSRYIIMFIAIAITLLLIASINFVNLATAKARHRIREVGIRKSAGAHRIQLITQFLTESIIIAFLALIAGILTLQLTLPSLNTILESEMKIPVKDPVFLLGATGLSILIGIISGSYIAFYISAFRPINILKAYNKTGKSDFNFRKGLLVFQFTATLILVICSLVIFRQLRYVQKKDLGLDQEHIINLAVYGKSNQEKIQLFKEEIEKLPMILNTAASSFVPGFPNFHQSVYYEGQEEPMGMYIIVVDKDFIETMKMELVEGSIELIKNSPGEVINYILNEKAIKTLGWESAEGRMFGVFEGKPEKSLLGVVKDFNFQSLHSDIAPVVLAIGNRFDHDQISIRIQGDGFADALPAIKRKFNEILPDVPFEFDFMDTQFYKLYKSEKRAGKIIGFLTGISLLIALFGLFAMGSYAIQEKTKEIAIRKVFGISRIQQLWILIREFLLLTALGNVLAWPVSWILMNRWLMNFSFGVNLNIYTFLCAAAFTIVIVLVIIGTQALRTLKLNAAESLRYE